MNRTMVADPVVVYQVENTTSVAPLPFQIDVPPPLPTMHTPLPPPFPPLISPALPLSPAYLVVDKSKE